ncbi:right-handed parallel beta-helix repeat-containing protein [uncultured Desulfosarcina sp.]|uniref:right-handed parallel beta-helix repeat-containing protein n=1 Tax=uncultured Desulfosarcina sp. TaxID=218289 RepID=UPI0029C7A306|nr:right-handed parallel beta-helix repeat-containing protein [uncultured Desulfosarcina sp.]
MKLVKTTFYTILIIFLLSSYSNAQTYHWYFSDDSTGNPIGNDQYNNGSKLSPWKSLSKANAMLAKLSSSDIATLYFDRGDIWAFDWAINGVLKISSGTVTITDYGSGKKPVFDGEIDFSNPPAGIIDPSPYRWHAVISVNSPNATIENIEIKRNYGMGIITSKNGMTVQDCVFHDSGATSIGNSTSPGATSLNTTIQRNEFYNGQQLNFYKIYTGWGAAIGLVSCEATGSVIRYNKLSNIYGEGIIVGDCTVEYNFISDTYSAGIYCAPHKDDGGHIIIRYNLVVGTSDPTYYIAKTDGRKWSSMHGIGITDEWPTGNNDNCYQEVYSNIVIGCYRGIKIYTLYNDKLNMIPDNIPKADIYNNILADNRTNFDIGWSGGISNYDEINIFNNKMIKSSTSKLGAQTAVESGLLPVAKVNILKNEFWTKDETPSPNYNNTENFNEGQILLNSLQAEKILNDLAEWYNIKNVNDVKFDYSTKKWHTGIVVGKIVAPINFKLSIN